jgi:hypothetical protein
MPNPDEDGEDENDERSNTRDKKKARWGSKTIEKNHDNLIAKHFDKSLDFDPYFKSISKLFDASKAAGLMMSSLSCHNDLKLCLEAVD